MRLVPLALAALLAAAPVSVIAEPYTLDKSHAHVKFEVGHLGFSTTHGQFRTFDADISFDPEKVEETKVTFTIEAASVDTLWEARDNHIRGKDFLDVDNHPQITFVSKSVTPTGGDSADIVGDLTIRGVTNEITLIGKLNKLGPSPFNAEKTVAGFTVTGEIDRTKWGINYAAPAVSAVMPIRIDLEMSPSS